MTSMYCPECGVYLGSMGGVACGVCGWQSEHHEAKPAQAVDAQPVAQEPWGWAIVDKDGNERDTRCRRVSMFGWSREHQSYGADAVERWDREWPGLAPHRVVTLYTTAQPAAPLRRLTEEQIVSAVLDEAKRQAGGEFAGLTMDVDAFRELLKVIRAIEPAFAEANGLTLGDAGPNDNAVGRP